jgi:hypothetical protein
MKVQILVAVAALFALGLFAFGDGITGLAVDDTMAYSLHSHAMDFFGTSELIFPPSQCSQTLSDLYNDVARAPLDVSTGFSTTGGERLSTLSFVIDRTEKYGTADFVKSPTFIYRHVDSLISINTEAVVRVPKETRTTYVVMDLYGSSSPTPRGSLFLVQGGRFSTPSVDCFFVYVNGRTVCDCDVHSIQGIAIGGITSAPFVEENYAALLDKYTSFVNESYEPIIGSQKRDFVIE